MPPSPQNPTTGEGGAPIWSKIGEFFAGFKPSQHGADWPYTRRCPVIFDQDDHLNGYTAEYLMALASAGEIDLRAIVVGNLWPETDPDEVLAGHASHVEAARRSGLRNLPEILAGAFCPLKRPGSSQPEDTVPMDTPGARKILNEARQATPENPLLVVTAGHLTSVASALLLDPRIAPCLVVAAALGQADDMGDYNGLMDSWAAYIVLRQVRYVQFPAGISPPRVPKRRFQRLPPTEFRQGLIDKRTPYAGPKEETDVDAAPAISLMRPDYVVRARRVAFSHWVARAVRNIPGRSTAEYPVFKPDPAGTAWVVTRARDGIATREFWRGLRNPKAWHTPE